MNSFIKNLPRPVCIYGMGISGKAAQRLLILSGLSNKDIITFDSVAGRAEFSNLDEVIGHRIPGTFIVSPGIWLESPEVKKIKSLGAKILSEIDLAFSFLTTERVIGITGSVGKSTVCSLIGAGIESVTPLVFVGGNLGTPLATYVCELLEATRPRAEWLVLELSSFQLENASTLICDYSVITFFSANHLERYSSLQSYYQTKWSLIDKTKHCVFLNRHSLDLIAFAKLHPQEKLRLVGISDISSDSFDFTQSKLVGKHNEQNLALAYSLLKQTGLDSNFSNGLKSFPGLKHRLQFVKEINGVRFINDSKATAIDSIITALESILISPSNVNEVFLLVGGRDKKLNWQDLVAYIQSNKLSHKVHLCCFGESKDLIAKHLNSPNLRFDKMALAVEYAATNAKPKDIVLLSPGGSSFDEFKNFEERGDVFTSIVNNL